MSENVFGQWKMRFPILRQMRHSVRTSQKIILATAVLHNMSKVHGLDMDEGHPCDVDEVEPEDQLVRPRYENRNLIRLAGKRVRDQL